MDNAIENTGMNRALQILSNQSQPRLLFWLGFRPFNEDELDQLLPNSNSHEIDDNLTSLRDLGIVSPVRNHEERWSLTENGHSLRDLMISLCVWGRHQVDNDAERVSDQIVEPEQGASLSELVKYGTTLDKYFN